MKRRNTTCFSMSVQKLKKKNEAWEKCFYLLLMLYDTICNLATIINVIGDNLDYSHLQKKDQVTTYKFYKFI